MDSFDRQILTVLKDGKPRDFQQLLREAGFSHNTLKLRLASVRQGVPLAVVLAGLVERHLQEA